MTQLYKSVRESKQVLTIQFKFCNYTVPQLGIYSVNCQKRSSASGRIQQIRAFFFQRQYSRFEPISGSEHLIQQVLLFDYFQDGF